jgi:hypothetical protein
VLYKGKSKYWICDYPPNYESYSLSGAHSIWKELVIHIFKTVSGEHIKETTSPFNYTTIVKHPNFIDPLGYEWEEIGFFIRTCVIDDDKTIHKPALYEEDMVRWSKD